jgi:hypothetical protein
VDLSSHLVPHQRNSSLHVKIVYSVVLLSGCCVSLCILQVMCLLQKGNRARTVEPTAANKTSSRSHALLSVTVQQTSPLQTVDKMKSRIKHGKLFMIDLAGSERASQTKVITQLTTGGPWEYLCIFSQLFTFEYLKNTNSQILDAENKCVKMLTTVLLKLMNTRMDPQHNNFKLQAVAENKVTRITVFIYS